MNDQEKGMKMSDAGPMEMMMDLFSYETIKVVNVEPMVEDIMAGIEGMAEDALKNMMGPEFPKEGELMDEVLHITIMHKIANKIGKAVNDKVVAKCDELKETPLLEKAQKEGELASVGSN